MKVIVFLSATSLATQGPRVDHLGASGHGYPYEFSTRHGKHILYGRELDAEELAKVAPDIFGAEKSFRVPTPALVPGDNPEPSAEIPVDPAPTVDRLYAAAATLPKEEQRRLGFNLVNATRPPRAERRKNRADAQPSHPRARKQRGRAAKSAKGNAAA